MFNLLPDNLKKSIQSDYKMRRLILALVFVLFIQISFLVFLFPTWLISYYRDQKAISDQDILNGSVEASTTLSVTNTIKLYNARLGVVNSVMNYPKVLPAVNLILSKRTSSIKLNEFAYSSSNSKTANISIGGISSTREALVSFEKNLKDSGYFKSVDLPVSNLAKDSNITFSINLSISQ